MSLADRLAEGVGALREGRNAEAVSALQEVVDDPQFRGSEELLDVRARATSLLAQALLAVDEVGPADRYARQALDVLERLADPEGKAQVTALRQEIMGRALTLRKESEQRARRSRLLALPVAELLASTQIPQERANLLIERASAAAETGDLDMARDLAHQARHMADESNALKERVLSRLLVAQVDPETRVAALRAAYRLALAADEPGLITGIAQTAEQVGVPHTEIDGHS